MTANLLLRMQALVRTVLVAMAVALLALPAAAQPRSPAGVPVYVLRGALGIFSSGMDGLAVELNARGVAAESVAFDNWHDYTARIEKAYKARPYPIALVGHSWGANTILLMAYELEKRNIPVALLVFYDITNSARIPPNVRWVLNYRSNSATGAETEVVGGAGFAGKIDNITRPELSHVEIDKAEDLHRETIAAIRNVLARGSRGAGM